MQMGPHSFAVSGLDLWNSLAPELKNPSISWDTLEPHYNAHFGVHSDIRVITEQPYNEGLIHRKYKQWESCL